MKKVALILPFFGKFPNYFDFWIETAKKNMEFDFLIFSDNDINNKFLNNSQNIHFYKISFKEIKKLIFEKLKYNIVLDTPYKLCDYRPAYGIIFEDYIKSYDFWGHCDSDIIWGKLSNFINDKILDKYDRIYSRGHLTLYKNIEEINKFYMKKHKYADCFSYKYVFNTNFSCSFDEWGTKYGGGISEVFFREKVSNYEQYDFADIYPDPYEFFLDDGKKTKIEYFEYINGKIYGYTKENQKIEYAYIHLQKRKIAINSNNYLRFYLVLNNIVNNIKDIDYLKEDKNTYYKLKRKEIINRKIKKVFNGAIWHLIDKRRKKINI